MRIDRTTKLSAARTRDVPAMLRLFAIAAFCVATTSRVHAAVVGVDFNDDDGPHWTGIVDTATDELTINTWVENSGGSPFWTPSLLPQTWTATTASGTMFDVPDSFATSISIGTDWAFLPATSNAGIAWNEGTASSSTGGVGWGGGRNTGGTILTNFSQTAMIFMPESETVSNGLFGVATITVVPEPSSATLLVVCLLGIFGCRRRAQCIVE